jgi:hypothetical protein
MRGPHVVARSIRAWLVTQLGVRQGAGNDYVTHARQRKLITKIQQDK